MTPSAAALGVHFYQAYGLTLETNQPVPGLADALDPAAVAVRVELAGAHYSGPALTPEAELMALQPPPGSMTGEPVHSVWQMRGETGIFYRLRFAGATQHIDYIIKAGGDQIWVTWPDDVPYEYVVSLFIGPVLAMLLSFRRMVCLHGSVLAVDGQAIALLGPAGAGKSTTVAALARRGLAVMADDVTVLTQSPLGLMVHPGTPRLWVKPDAVRALGGSPEQLPEVLFKGGKRQVDLEAAPAGDWRFERQALPLAAIYLLGPRRPTDRAPTVTPVTPYNAMLALQANRYWPTALVTDNAASVFSVLGRVAQSVPVRQLSRPDSLSSLPQLCDLILSDARALMGSPPEDGA